MGGKPMNFAKRFLFNLATRLTRDDAASTFNRLATSQHVADLQLIFISTCVLMVVLPAIVILGWGLTEANISIPVVAPVAAILGAGFSVLAWTYQSGSARLGIVDLFGAEIATLCRVSAIVEMAPLYKEMYCKPPKQPPAFISQEQYTPVFDHNSKDLEVLEARVVKNVTQFYAYLKVVRDYLRVLSTIQEPEGHPTEWKSVMVMVIYMLFLMLESGRESIRRLIEYEPEREQNIITILLSEIVAYGLLLKIFEHQAEKNPGYSAKLERLRLRREGYDTLVRRTVALIRDHMGAEDPDREQWESANALLEELNHRYQDAFGCPAPTT
jgi:hypothetical protein